MDRREYFTRLINLYEATINSPEETEVVPQENIADTGEDVMPAVANQEIDNNENQEADLDNTVIDDPSSDIQTLPQTTAELLEIEKIKKMFSLLSDLENYSSLFCENLKFIDISLLDDETYKNFKFYMENINSLSGKLRNYIKNIFNSEKYENILYSYILFRTEMLTNIRGIRNILKLDNPDEKFK